MFLSILTVFLFTLPYFTPVNTYPIRQNTLLSWLDWLGYGFVLIGWPLGLSTLVRDSNNRTKLHFYSLPMQLFLTGLFEQAYCVAKV